MCFEGQETVMQNHTTTTSEKKLFLQICKSDKIKHRVSKNKLSESPCFLLRLVY